MPKLEKNVNSVECLFFYFLQKNRCNINKNNNNSNKKGKVLTGWTKTNELCVSDGCQKYSLTNGNNSAISKFIPFYFNFSKAFRHLHSFLCDKHRCSNSIIISLEQTFAYTLNLDTTIISNKKFFFHFSFSLLFFLFLSNPCGSFSNPCIRISFFHFFLLKNASNPHTYRFLLKEKFNKTAHSFIYFFFVVDRKLDEKSEWVCVNTEWQSNRAPNQQCEIEASES